MRRQTQQREAHIIGKGIRNLEQQLAALDALNRQGHRLEHRTRARQWEAAAVCRSILQPSWRLRMP